MFSFKMACKQIFFWRTPVKVPSNLNFILVLLKNGHFRRGWGAYVILVEKPEGWGVINSLKK